MKCPHNQTGKQECGKELTKRKSVEGLEVWVCSEHGDAIIRSKNYEKS